MHDVVLTGGRVLDPVNNIEGAADLAIRDGRVSEVGRITTGARRTLDVGGRWILPGVIDTHTHLSRHFGSGEGHHMVAQTGVVTALDLAGSVDDLSNALTTGGAGLNVAFIHPLIPHDTVTSQDPDAAEIDRQADGALASGAIGLKILGGHYPLTPEAIGRIINAATSRRCYVASHVGSTATGSDVRGLAETLDLAAGRRIHIAHVNSYCRGQITSDPAGEVQQALDLLAAHPSAVSESYLSVYNGTSAQCRDGVPTSNVTKTCLRLGGFEISQRGLEQAIAAGYARIHRVAGGEVVLSDPAAGAEEWRARGTDAGVSFPVNHIPSAILLAATRRDGRFVVDGLSTDGGAIPRNFLVRHGLMLVQMGGWTLRDFVVKASVNPARMLGLPRKGHLSLGADGDVTIVDVNEGRAVWSFARGEPVLADGKVVGRRGLLMTTSRGVDLVRARNIHHETIHPEGWK
jgi:hypothetical protein